MKRMRRDFNNESVTLLFTCTETKTIVQFNSQVKEAVKFERCAVEQTHSQCQCKNLPV